MDQWKIVTIDDGPRSATSGHGVRDLVGTLAGGVLVAAGAYLPWLQANPASETAGLGLVPGLMTPGLGLLDFVLVFPAIVVLATLLVRGPTRGWALAAVVTGLWALLFSVQLVVVQYTGDGLRFVPGLGWALTVGGGLVLAFVGGRALFGSNALLEK